MKKNEKSFKKASWLILALILCNTLLLAQTYPIYIDGPIYVSSGSNLQFFGNAEMAATGSLNIESGEKAVFYGAAFKMNTGAQIASANSAFTTSTQGSGTGTIVFKQANPMDASTVQQTLDGGNSGSGNVAISTSNTFASIEIDNTSGVKLVNSDSRVGTDIKFTNGHLFTDTKDMVLATAATLTGYDATKYVVTAGTGHLDKESYSTAFVFPVGQATSDFTPTTITPGAANTIHVNVATYANSGSVESYNDGVNRTWNIFGNSNTAALISLQHNTTTNQPNFLPGANFVTRYGSWLNSTGDAVGQSFWQLNTTGASTAGTVAGSEVRSRNYTDLAVTASANEAYFSKASDLSHPLPIVLRRFSGSVVDCNTVLLQWVTETEQTGESFIIQRSTDGVNFATVKTVQANGNPSTYNEIISQGVGIYYYRIKLMHNTGNSTYSNVLVLRNNCTIEDKFTVVPNPVKTGTNTVLSYTTNNKGKAQVWFTDQLGRMYAQQMIQVNKGANLIKVNTQLLAQGLYYIRIVAADGNWATPATKLIIIP